MCIRDRPLTGDVHRVATTWMGKMHFASSVNNHTIHTDKLKVHGGDDRGPRPGSYTHLTLPTSDLV